MKTQSLVHVLLLVICLFSTTQVHAQADQWYEEYVFQPQKRIKIEVINTLDFDRSDCPVTISRQQFPLKALHELWVKLVDPALPPNPEPSEVEVSRGGGHMLRGEKNGHMIPRQLDDLDKDGVWDELFFQTDIKANSTKTFYVYIGYDQRGWCPHGTHANIGSYLNHLVPFWESRHIGWKLWYPTDCDMYGKRTSGLMSHELYMKNLCGYYDVSYEQGSDIMTVSKSFGAGGIALFEVPSAPDSVARPRFTSVRDPELYSGSFNESQIHDTRYAFEVVVNGPVRSMIKAKTMNWSTDNGFYELEQWYTAYTNQNYATCTVKYTKFLPKGSLPLFGCGMRKNAGEFEFYQENGIVISIGNEEIADPDDDSKARRFVVDFVGTALVVKDDYRPEYQYVPSFEGNHAFRIPVNDDLTYEYLIAGAWSEGLVLNTPAAFRQYVLKAAEEYNNPVHVTIGEDETKEQ